VVVKPETKKRPYNSIEGGDITPELPPPSWECD